MNQATWDLRFLSLAYTIASWSKDPDTKVGAVLVSSDRRQFSVGYNGYIAGANDDYDLPSEVKLNLTIHAELNAILNARRSIEGWTVYITKAPCRDCAKALIQAGIAKAVHCHPGEGKWFCSQIAANNLMRSANVEVKHLSRKDLA